MENKMKNITAKKIEHLLDLHTKWLAGEQGGVQLQLHGIRFEEGSSFAIHNLSFIILENCIGNDINFACCNFNGAKITECKFKNSTFTGATFKSASISFSNMRDSNFYRCKIDGTTFNGCDMINAKLDVAYIKYSFFRKVYLTNACFINSDISSSDFTDSQMYNTNFESARLDCVKFESTEMLSSNIRDAILSDAKFTNCILCKTSFLESTLLRIKFLHTDLTNASFSTTNINNANFIDVTFNQTTFRCATLSEVQFPKDIDLEKVTELYQAKLFRIFAKDKYIQVYPFNPIYNVSQNTVIIGNEEGLNAVPLESFKSRYEKLLGVGGNGLNIYDISKNELYKLDTLYDYFKAVHTQYKAHLNDKPSNESFDLSAENKETTMAVDLDYTGE